MSWLIQTLVQNRKRIKEEHDFGSDNYNDVLLVEKAIKELYEKGVISNDELSLLNFISENGNNQSVLQEEFNLKDRLARSVRTEFESICERIAFYMGGYFTNDGYIDYMASKYNLTDDQVSNIRNYIKSGYKHKIRIKITNDKN